MQKLRWQIDKTDEKLVQLLEERAQTAKEIGQAKGGGAVYLPAREAQVLKRVQKLNQGPLTGPAITGIFREIIASCRNLERLLRVAYLGPEGSYSEEAAVQFAGQTSDFFPRPTVDDALATVCKNEADIAVLPVENSTEGAVSRTLDLLLGSNLVIAGEVLLPVAHQLLSKQKDPSKISQVLAHPQALAQCRQWLTEHLPGAKQITMSSNAEAARRASEYPSLAAIAGKRASKIYKLPAIAANIEDATNNVTRFLVLSTQETPPTGDDKTSLVCSVPNRAGSLFKLIGIFAKKDINMTKLESRPAKSALWDYVFYIDIDGHQDDEHIAESLRLAREHAAMVKVLGSYPRAK